MTIINVQNTRAKYMKQIYKTSSTNKETELEQYYRLAKLIRHTHFIEQWQNTHTSQVGMEHSPGLTAC